MAEPNIDPQAARSIAVEAHGDQRYGHEPYVVHLDAVATIARPFGAFAEALAYLHDLFEDTAASRASIAAAFGQSMVRAIDLMTDTTATDRAARKAATNAKLRSINDQDEMVVLVVKPADRLANARASLAPGHEHKLAMYRREHADFKAAAYRPGVADAIWTELDAILTPDNKDRRQA